MALTMKSLIYAKMSPFEKASSGAMVADPLTLYDCCPTSDGASAVILVADHLAHQFTDTPIWGQRVWSRFR